MADAAVLPENRGSGFTEALACPDRGDGRGERRLGLFVRAESRELAGTLRDSLPRLAAAANSDGLYDRYCVDPKAIAEADQALPWGGQASRYSRLIAKYAREVGLDWRLVAAVISEESGFEEIAVSSKGATGLMQLMPGVPGTEAVRNRFDPEPNIRAGVLYLRHLHDMFRHGGGADELAIVLAAYLVGPGHVLDAQALAREIGADPNRWRGGLDKALPLLEDQRYYSRTRFGYAQGQLAVGYVNRIFDRYDLYKRHMDARPGQTASADRAARDGSA
jgi:membrane-bound lytic murein transglycosylase F